MVYSLGKEAHSSPSPTVPALALVATLQRYVKKCSPIGTRIPLTDSSNNRWNSPSSSQPSSAATNSNPTKPPSRPAKVSCASPWASMWVCVGGSRSRSFFFHRLKGEQKRKTTLTWKNGKKKRKLKGGEGEFQRFRSVAHAIARNFFGYECHVYMPSYCYVHFLIKSPWWSFSCPRSPTCNIAFALHIPTVPSMKERRDT